MARRKTERRTHLIEQLMLQARRTGSVGTLHNRAAADLVGMNQTDWDCLDLLDWTGPIPAGELAKRLGMTSGAITGVLDRLEAIGVARRVADPGDRRRVIVELVRTGPTPTDPRFADVHARFMQLGAEMAALSDQFEDEEIAVLVRWLQGSNDIMERATERMRER